MKQKGTIHISEPKSAKGTIIRHGTIFRPLLVWFVDCSAFAWQLRAQTQTGCCGIGHHTLPVLDAGRYGTGVPCRSLPSGGFAILIMLLCSQNDELTKAICSTRAV